MDYQWFAIAAKGALLPIPCDEENYDANLVALPRERTEEFLNLLGQKMRVIVELRHEIEE